MKIANKVLKTVKRAQRMYIPDKAYLHALWSGPNCPFMINAIPKSGTNLLKAIMRMFPGVTEMGTFKFAQDSSRVDNRLHYVNHVINCRKRGAMYYGHLPYDSDVSGWLMDNKIKMLLLYRDPRDVVVSRVHYIMNKGGTYTRKDSPTYDDYPLYASFKSHSERLMAAIEGFGEGKKEFKYYSGRDIPNIRVVFEEYCKWAEEDNVLSLRYEDLIADKESQITQGMRICDFLKIKTDRKSLDSLLTKGSDPNRSSTFRKGGSGNWRKELSEDHLKRFYSIFGEDFLQQLGYDI